jgi:hypothetical protein
MKKRLQLFVAMLSLFLSSQAVAEELQPTVVNVTVYRIENFSNGKFLSNGDNTQNDARIIFAERDDNSAGQEWAMYPTDVDGVFCFVNPTSGKAIDMAPNVGYPVQWNYDSKNANQRFKIVAPGDGYNRMANASNPYQFLALSADGYPMMLTEYADNDIRFYFHNTGKLMIIRAISLVLILPKRQKFLIDTVFNRLHLAIDLKDCISRIQLDMEELFGLSILDNRPY